MCAIRLERKSWCEERALRCSTWSEYDFVTVKGIDFAKKIKVINRENMIFHGELNKQLPCQRNKEEAWCLAAHSPKCWVPKGRCGMQSVAKIWGWPSYGKPATRTRASMSMNRLAWTGECSHLIHLFVPDLAFCYLFSTSNGMFHTCSLLVWVLVGIFSSLRILISQLSPRQKYQICWIWGWAFWNAIL